MIIRVTACQTVFNFHAENYRSCIWVQSGLKFMICKTIHKPGCLHTYIHSFTEKYGKWKFYYKRAKKGENIPMVINSNRGDLGVGLQYSRIRS